MPDRLVVLAPNWLGDAVMSLPLLNDIRREWPATFVAMAARPSVAPFYRLVDAVDDVVALKGAGGMRAIRAIRANATELAAHGFDAALLLPNSFVSALLVSRAGISQRWGFRSDWRARLLTHAIPRPPRSVVHQAAYYQALGSGLGITATAPHARVFIPPEARAAAQALLHSVGLGEGDRFVVMGPGAAYGKAKQWLPDRFADLARLLGAERDVKTVLIGAAADAAVCRDIAARAGGTIDLTGRTDIPTLAALLAAAQAVVVNDSGAMHLAAAVGARVIAIFGPTNEHKSAPLAAGLDTPSPTIVATTVWCRPCMLRECPIDHRCMTGIDVQTVLRHL